MNALIPEWKRGLKGLSLPIVSLPIVTVTNKAEKILDLLPLRRFHRQVCTQRQACASTSKIEMRKLTLQEV